MNKSYYSLQIQAADGPMYLESIRLRRGTIYASSIAFTNDKRAAARFETVGVFNDAVDAVELFLGRKGRTCAACIPAHRNGLGTVYISFA